MYKLYPHTGPICIPETGVQQVQQQEVILSLPTHRSRLLEMIEGAETLAYLTETDTSLQQVASINDHLIHILAHFLQVQVVAPPPTDSRLKREANELKDRLKEAAFKAFASLGANDEEIRKKRMPCHRKRRQFKQTDAFTWGMVIGLKRAGWSIRQIAADTHLGASTVHRLWRRWLEQGNVAIYRNVGATRVTSARVDRRILRQAVAAPQATCTAILQHVQDTLDHSISTRTISRRLVANGLHSCRPLRRLPLTPPNRRQRLEWCRDRSTWMTEWHRVVFSDESRFCLSSDSRRVRVWRRCRERSNPAAIVERSTVRQRGIMVWGAIAYDSRSPLLHIQGTMTAQRYVDDVLRPVTLPYLQGVPNALYQQDNARPHTARISQQALQDIIETESLMEHIVSVLCDPSPGVRLAAVRCLHSLSRSVQQLRTTFQDHAVWRPLMDLCQNAPDDILGVASSTLCNLLLEFSPSKEPILERGAIELLCRLTRKEQLSLRLNGVWALMNMAFQADQKVKSQILATLGTDQVFRLLSDPDLHVLMKTLGLLRNLLSTKLHIDHIMNLQGHQILQAVILILEGEHAAEVKEQALCILANIADGATAKSYIMANDDVLRKLSTYMVGTDPSLLYLYIHMIQAMIIMVGRSRQLHLLHIHVKCNSTCVRSVVMKSNREFENRAAIIVALRAGRSPKEIVDFLKLPKTTIYRVKKQFDEADSNKEGIATRKKHSRRSDRVRGEEFVKNVKEKIDGNPGKSMRAIAKEMDVGSMTIVRTIHEDLGLKSYALRKGQLLTENMKNNRKGKAAALLNNLKHDSFGMLRFFSDEKNFDVDQKVNPRNDRWICKDPSEIPVVMHTKFPASVMVLGVISNEGDVMPPHFFEKGLRMNADTYINVLETVVKPWMDMVAAGR
ncbi:ARMC8, partial [Cordylochernes scorpioides]